MGIVSKCTMTQSTEVHILKGTLKGTTYIGGLLLLRALTSILLRTSGEV